MAIAPMNPNSIAQSENDAVALRLDNESSMLKADEKAIAHRSIKRVVDRYQDTLKERGGTEKVIQELAHYLAEKIGDPLSESDPSHRQGTDPYRTALRCILDPAPPRTADDPGASFKNAITQLSAPFKYDSQQPGLTLKELTAYYWLAASDPNMPVSDADLESVSDNNAMLSEEEKKAMLSEGEKENFILRLSDIRRAHNGDEGYHQDDSLIDEPSCSPGTYGRIVTSSLYNQVGKLLKSPTASFPWNIEAFISKKFKASSNDVISGYDFYIEQKLLFSEPEENATTESQRKAYDEFVQSLKNDEDRFIEEILVQNEFELTPEQLTYARTLYQTVCHNINFSEDKILPRATLIDEMNKEDVRRKKIAAFEDISSEMKVVYKKYHDEATNKMESLVKEIKELDLKSLDNHDLVKKQAEFTARYNEITKERQLSEESFLSGFKEGYEKKLRGLAIEPTLQDINQIKIKAVDDDGSIKEKLHDAINSFEYQFPIYQEKIKIEKRDRMDQAFTLFIAELNGKEISDLSGAIEGRIISSRTLMDSAKASPPDDLVTNIGVYNEKFSDHQKELEDNIKAISDQFIAQLTAKGFTVSREDSEFISEEIRSTFFAAPSKELTDLNSDLKVLNEYVKILNEVKVDLKSLLDRTRNKISESISNLNRFNIKVGSSEESQLRVLEEAQKSLQEMSIDIPGEERLTFSSINNDAESVKKTLNTLKEKLDTIGYPSDFKLFLEKARNGIAKILNTLFRLGMVGPELIEYKKSFSENPTESLKSEADAFLQAHPKKDLFFKAKTPELSPDGEQVKVREDAIKIPKNR